MPELVWKNILKFLLLELKELGIDGRADITFIFGKNDSIAEIKTTIKLSSKVVS